MAASTNFEERRWTSRDGLSLYARDYPAVGEKAGLPVIALHGLTRNSKDFEEIAPIIACWGRRVIVPDVRGRGQSARDPNPLNYRPPVYARDVVEMMAALKIPQAVFLGTSMGGIITMALAALQPRAIVAAILNDVGPAIAPEGVARILSYAGKRANIGDWDEAADYVRRTNAVAFPDFKDEDWRKFARRTIRDNDGVPGLDYDTAIALALTRPPGRVSQWMASWLFRKLARKRLTLLVRGELSDVVTDGIAANMQRAAPGLQQCVVPNVGHAPMLTEPEAVDAIARFLRTVA